MNRHQRRKLDAFRRHAYRAVCKRVDFKIAVAVVEWGEAMRVNYGERG